MRATLAFIGLTIRDHEKYQGTRNHRQISLLILNELINICFPLKSSENLLRGIEIN